MFLTRNQTQKLELKSFEGQIFSDHEYEKEKNT